MVEHWSPKPGVGRSSRSSRANFIKKMRKIKEYFKEVYNELVHKVTWPSWSELQNSMVVVMIASLIIAMVIYVMDVSFTKVMELVYSMFY